MTLFNANPNKVSETLKEGIDYIEITDGFGTKHKHVNFDNPNLIKREGIVEIVPLKESKGQSGQSKHDNHKVFYKFRDKKTKLIWGSFSHVDPDTKMLKYHPIVVMGRNLMDLSLEDEAIRFAMVKNGPYCEGSPNLMGKATYKVLDKAIIAEKSIGKRSSRREAEDIIRGLDRAGIKEMALNIGVNILANSNPVMLEDEVYRVMESDPVKFIGIYNNPKRYYISIFNKALADGVITLNHESGLYKYQGLELGHTEEMAVKYLSDNKGTANAIHLICTVNDEGTAISMNYEAKKDGESELESLKRQLAELKNSKDKDPVIENDPKIDQELIDLRAEAKELKITGYALPSISKETLMAKIEKAKLDKDK